jgi:glycosyltransferase involved in cell wall biosynthesis
VTEPGASIVIPAHNEEQVIGVCLETMLAGAHDGELEIIVVANGCRDRTAARARAVDPAIRVVELEAGSKPRALNAGDEAATVFPRFYVDADVQVGIDAIRKVAAALEAEGTLAAAPRMVLDLDGRPWRVRAFYDTWSKLHYVTDAHIGSGVYAVSAAGRARFDRFPDIVADDMFIHSLFDPGERVSVPDAEFVDRAPRTLRGLLKIKGRAAAGNFEYRAKYAAQASHADAANRRRGAGAGALVRDPSAWPALGLYTAVYAAAQARGWWKFRFGDLRHWDRDDSARDLPPRDTAAAG